MSDTKVQEVTPLCYLYKKEPTDQIEVDFVKDYGICLQCDAEIHDESISSFREHQYE